MTFDELLAPQDYGKGVPPKLPAGEMIAPQSYGAAAPVSPVTAVANAATKLPFYKRPIGFGALLRGLTGGVPGQVLTAALAGGTALKAGEDAMMNSAVGTPLAPGFGAQVNAAGGAEAFSKEVQSRVAAPTVATPQAQSGSVGKEQTPNVNYSAQAIYAMDNAQGAPVPRPAAAPVTTPAVEDIEPNTAMGGIIGNLLRIKQISGDAGAKRANQKLLVDALGKTSTARKDAAAAAIDETAVRAAQAEAAGGGTPGSVGAVLRGRVPADKNVFFPGIDPRNPNNVIVGNSGSGAVTVKTPQTQVSTMKEASSGKYFVKNADGSKGRELTADEIARLPKK